MDKHCNNCELLKMKVILLQEELSEYKKNNKCPNCEKLRAMLEQIQETVAELKRSKK